MFETGSVGPTGRHRIVQVHPTRRCNLECLHCYSSSGPKQTDHLEPAVVAAALRDASDEGYTVAGFSGGEPLLYEPLGEVLACARQRGLRTTVTTNGTLLDERRLARLEGVLDLIAISLDGVPASHDRMRARKGAFRAMERRLELVRRTEIPFGFIFTLTQHNVHELDWAARFALEQGASLLQIHPLEETGRAEQLCAGAKPDHVESSFAYLEAVRIQQQVGSALRVHLDLADREELQSTPERAFAHHENRDVTELPLAELVSPLIVEADAAVVPIQHGFGRSFALGNLREGRLRELARAWKRDRYDAFRDVCRGVFESSRAPDTLPFFNWYEAITTEGLEREKQLRAP